MRYARRTVRVIADVSRLLTMILRLFCPKCAYYRRLMGPGMRIDLLNDWRAAC